MTSSRGTVGEIDAYNRGYEKGKKAKIELNKPNLFNVLVNMRDSTPKIFASRGSRATEPNYEYDALCYAIECVKYWENAKMIKDKYSNNIIKVKRLCEYCGEDVAIRNPTGNCDHLNFPECVNKDYKKGV